MHLIGRPGGYGWVRALLTDGFEELYQSTTPKILKVNFRTQQIRPFEKMKANIRIGEVKVICKPIETKRGFMTCGFTRLVTGSQYQDVYLISVVFLRNREVITLTLYRNAEEPGDLVSLVEVGKEYLAAL